MSSESIEIHMDNRGTDKVPFGFIYVGESRVGFADSLVWLTKGWAANEGHLERAADYLTEHFGYGWYPEEY